MALPKFEKDMRIVSMLSDRPNAASNEHLDGLQLKQKFDEGGEALKEYINETLIPFLAGSEAAASLGIGTISGISEATNIQQALEALKRAIDSIILDGLVADAALSKDSINPIQNKAVAIEFERVRDEQKKHIVVGPSEPDNGPALWFNTNYASGGAVAAMLTLDDDETGAAMMANIEGNDYAMNNTTLNSTPTANNYDFTIL